MALVIIPIILACMMIRHSKITSENQRQGALGVLIVFFLAYLIYSYFTRGGA